jgi:hypothetical protein
MSIFWYLIAVGWLILYVIYFIENGTTDAAYMACFLASFALAKIYGIKKKED